VSDATPVGADGVSDSVLRAGQPDTLGTTGRRRAYTTDAETNIEVKPGEEAVVSIPLQASDHRGAGRSSQEDRTKEFPACV